MTIPVDNVKDDSSGARFSVIIEEPFCDGTLSRSPQNDQTLEPPKAKPVSSAVYEASSPMPSPHTKHLSTTQQPSHPRSPIQSCFEAVERIITYPSIVTSKCTNAPTDHVVASNCDLVHLIPTSP